MAQHCLCLKPWLLYLMAPPRTWDILQKGKAVAVSRVVMKTDPFLSIWHSQTWLLHHHVTE